MSHPFSVARRVEFCETDAAGIAHFSSFLCYMEQAEHALLRHLGTSVTSDIGDGWHLSWPRVHVECDYRGSARFEDCLSIQVVVERLGVRSVTYAFDFTLGEQSLASGKLVAVCCKVRPGEPLESMAIPAELRTSLQKYLV
ncbi:MAG: acyl-CoA thioesterase [Planctomycetales bacterium]|nr:acyl-CoA thioesterase [Planctomycetales bacterium]